MKKFLSFTFCIMLALTSFNAEAKIRRVGFFGTPVTRTDYANLQLAQDSSNTGDTIFIFPGSWIASVNRKLVFISYGYSASFLDSGLQNIKGALAVSITLNSGSTGCIFQGIDQLTVGANSGDSIKINRCNTTIFFNSLPSPAPGFKSWTITQSFINNIYFHQFNSSYIYAPVTNLNIANCYINYFYFGGSVSGSCTGVLTNNIFGGITNYTNFNNNLFSCRSNIFLCPNLLNGTAADFQYNISVGNYIPANNNKINVDGSSIFVGYPTQGSYSSDNRFMLASGSPAKGAGQSGNDCGIFDGNDTYRIGGIPPVPSFYKLTAPTNSPGTNPYTITFSVRGNN